MPENDEVRLNLNTYDKNLEITLEDHRQQIKNRAVQGNVVDSLSNKSNSNGRIEDGNQMAVGLALKLLKLINGDLKVTTEKSMTIHKITLPMRTKDQNGIYN